MTWELVQWDCYCWADYPCNKNLYYITILQDKSQFVFYIIFLMKPDILSQVQDEKEQRLNISYRKRSLKSFPKESGIGPVKLFK